MTIPSLLPEPTVESMNQAAVACPTHVTPCSGSPARLNVASKASPEVEDTSSTTEFDFSAEVHVLELLADETMCDDPLTPGSRRAYVIRYARASGHAHTVVPTSCSNEVELTMPSVV